MAKFGDMRGRLQEEQWEARRDQDKFEATVNTAKELAAIRVLLERLVEIAERPKL